jgi:hypothetical protein
VTLDHYFRTHKEDAVRLNAKEFMLHLQRAAGEDKWTSKGLGRAIKKQQSTLVKRYGMTEDGWKSGVQAYTYKRPSDIPMDEVEVVIPESAWAVVPVTKQ